MATAGIEARVQQDGTTSYRAHVYDKHTGRKIRKTFASRAEAVAWREDTRSALRKGKIHAPRPVTVRQAAELFLADCEAGLVRTRGGRTYKPSAVRAMEQNLRLRVLPTLGGRRFDELRRRDIQALVDKLDRAGATAALIQSTLLPLQVMYRRAVARDSVAVNPTNGIERPAVQSRRDVVVSVPEADTLLAVLSSETRAVWKVAMYAGLRRGELSALRCQDVRLAEGRLLVVNGWDKIAGEVTPKNGKPRRVPIVPELRDVLTAELMRHRDDDGNVIPDRRLFGPQRVERAYHDAQRTWTARGATPIDLHTCRHVFATHMIFAGVNIKALSEWLGHSSIKVTLDQYGHLLPGTETEAGDLHAAYLQRERAKVAA